MISLKPAHVSRYATISRLLLKYGRGDVVRQIGLPHDGNGEAIPPGGPESLAKDLESQGPTFVKLGQLLSTRPDFLPPEYLNALSRLQDDVKPMPLDFIEETVQQELGVRINRAFSEFEPAPIAAASIGQVHRARLRDGRRVAVKVQRPGLQRQVTDDLDALDELARVLDEHTDFGRRIRFEQIVEALREVMINELDYRQEAQNCRTFCKTLRDFERFVVPAVIDDFTSERVITLEYLEGAKITDLSPAVLIELDRSTLADELFRVYLHQVLVDGVFHADPHPGNLLLLPDRRIALMDFGMVSRVTPELRRRLIKLLMVMSDGRAEDTANEAIAMGRPYKRSQFHEAAFREAVVRMLGDNQGKPLEDVQAGRLMLELNAAAGDAGLKIPTSVMMLGKTLLNLDQVVSVLDPDFDPDAAIRRHAGGIFEKHSVGHITMSRVYETLLDSAEFLEHLPDRMNRFAELLAGNKVRIGVDALDEGRLIAGLQKIANRITAGLILAAMIVGASVMMHLETTLTLFGYPLIALLFFLAAAVTSTILLWKIFFGDESLRE